MASLVCHVAGGIMPTDTWLDPLWLLKILCVRAVESPGVTTTSSSAIVTPLDPHLKRFSGTLPLMAYASWPFISMAYPKPLLISTVKSHGQG